MKAFPSEICRSWEDGKDRPRAIGWLPLAQHSQYSGQHLRHHPAEARHGTVPVGWIHRLEKQSKGRYFMDSVMMEEYSDTAGISDDPHAVDRQISGMHPILKTRQTAVGARIIDLAAVTTAPAKEVCLIEELSLLDKRIAPLRKASGLMWSPLIF